MLNKNWLIIVFIFSIWSCSGDKEQAVTKDEAVGFAYKIETSIKKGNHSVFDSIFNEKVFAAKIASEAGSKSDKGFMKGITQSLDKMELGKQIISSMKGGTYEFLRHYEKDKKHHVIFRLYGEDGLNYHDLELVKMNDRIQAADMYVYTTGEPFSKTLSVIMVTMMDYAEKKSDNAALHYASYLRDIKALMGQQRYAEARETFNKLPEEFKKEKVFEILNIQIASQLDDSTYKKTLDRFEKKYAMEPSAQLALIDGHFLNKDFDKMLKAINTIDAAVQDPLLNYYRAIAYKQMSDLPNAIKYLELLQKQKPDFGDGIVELIANYMEMKDYDKASRLVAKYKSNNTFDQEKLSNIRWLYPAEADRAGL